MKKKITIDDLAGMVKVGFDDMAQRFVRVDERFDRIEERLDRIENFILKRHEQEIEQLKIRMRYLEDMLAVPLKK
ncbi:MAG: hypothetical protein Q8R30_01455 [bacterium]|nr:hypothetical protein [bacterium]MDZ4285474.1 hypothetical protein [Candidatus Sungbacteria bacterium]